MLRVVFMGTAEIGVPTLEALQNEPDFSLVAVVSQPDKPVGRELKLQPTPIKKAAIRLELPVLQPAKARDEAFLLQLKELQPEVIVVFAYGQILPQRLLDIPRFGCINVHTSLLPRYRGASPIQAALLNGDEETGVTFMKMDAGLDTGDMLETFRVPIEASDDAATLHDKLAQVSSREIVGVLKRWAAGQIHPRAQDSASASYAPKISRDSGRIDWRLPAGRLVNQLRAFTPWPGLFTTFQPQGKPLLLKVWRAEAVAGTGDPGVVIGRDEEGLLVGCGEGALRLLEVQREGGKRMPAREFLAGNPLNPGDRLG
jgi:methionyl-tRNA formyltransferase